MSSKLRCFFEFRIPLISYFVLFVAIFILYLSGFEIPSLSTIRSQIGSIILMAGFVIRIIATITTRYMGKIKIVGVYAICRQPLLLAQIISFIGLNIIIANPIFILATTIVFIANDLFSARRYEKILLHHYKEIWKIYANKTKFLLPFTTRIKDVFRPSISSTELDNTHNTLIFIAIYIILVEISTLSLL